VDIGHEDNCLIVCDEVSCCIDDINSPLKAIFEAAHCTEEAAARERGHDQDHRENVKWHSFFLVEFFLRFFTHAVVITLCSEIIELFLFFFPFYEAEDGCSSEAELDEEYTAPCKLLCKPAHQVDVNKGPYKCKAHTDVHRR